MNKRQRRRFVLGIKNLSDGEINIGLIVNKIMRLAKQEYSDTMGLCVNLATAWDEKKEFDDQGDEVFDVLQEIINTFSD